MRNSVANFIMALGLAAIGIVLGLRLIAYSEADDAPGGVVIGVLIIGGAVALGLRIALRKS